MADVKLDVKVSNLEKVKGYAFVFRGKPVRITSGKGTITWDDTETEWLSWHMVGDPGGTMDVEVFRDGTVISKRIGSKIPNSRPAGFDEIPIPQIFAGAATSAPDSEK
ncbi:hypothetical protein U1769_00035 [Sphingomonas sp. ZT3P38]|uniref:hypothetical protein n=1 Tax=Parasphingomonas zepuensis TaxID=3096161 RepID=UPI002FC86112